MLLLRSRFSAARRTPTAKPGHALARPGHCLVQESPFSGTSHSRAFLQVIRKRGWSCTISRCRSAGNPSSWRTSRITTALVVSTMAISSSMEWLGVFPSCARSLPDRAASQAKYHCLSLVCEVIASSRRLLRPMINVWHKLPDHFLIKPSS